MEVVAQTQVLADLYNSNPKLRNAVMRFWLGDGPPHCYVQEPLGPIKFDMTEEEMVADMKRAVKRHVIAFDPRSRNGRRSGVTLTASDQAMADLAEWAKAE
jgi:hypothetical protein